MRRRVTPPKYARKAFNTGKRSGCLIYIITGLGMASGALTYLI
ncbi:hypothetical protein [Oceanobacillus sp. FSL H7-0719]